MTSYPEDEFDKAARKRGPKGAHRPVEPAWRKYLPVLGMLLLGVVLAWVVVTALTRDRVYTPTDNSTDVVASETTSAPAEETTTAAPTETEPPAPVILYDAQIDVFNGTLTNGLAGVGSQRLTDVGFTAVIPGNWAGGATPEVSTVFYGSADLADTAYAVASTLGIGYVIEDAGQTASISVVLRGDFQG